MSHWVESLIVAIIVFVVLGFVLVPSYRHHVTFEQQCAAKGGVAVKGSYGLLVCVKAIP